MSNIRFLKPFDSIPKGEFFIYALKAPSVSETAIFRTVKTLKLNGNLKVGKITKDSDVITYVEGLNVVNIFRASGFMRKYDMNRWQIDDGKSSLDVSDQDAIAIATRYINETGLLDLKQHKLSKVTRLYSGTLEKGSNKATERVIDSGVVFQRYVNGIPVDGPGGRTIIYIDKYKSVTGFDRMTRLAEPLEQKKLIPTKEMIPPKYIQENIRKQWEREDIENIDVRETKFAYFELGPDEKQKTLYPVYISFMDIVSGDSRREGRMLSKTVQITPAVPIPPEVYEPPLKKFIRELPRKE